MMDSANQFTRQPVLQGTTLLLRPLTTNDFDILYAVASDPLIWEQHPNPLRYQRPVFEQWFADAMASEGALVVLDRHSGQAIGSSRYYGWDGSKQEVAIGYTFLARHYWGGATNAELKKLMVNHALQWVRTVWFHVGPNNIRSQMALKKIGAEFSHRGMIELSGNAHESFFYTITSAL
jgi:RimJ/RimL family protein N-acetyltransferase